MMDFDQYREPYLSTERLALEPITAWHGESLYTLMREPLLYTYMSGEPPTGAGVLIKRFEALETRRSPDGSELWLSWAVRQASGGYVGFVEVHVTRDGEANIAGQIFQAAQRQGFGRETIRCVTDHLRGLGAKTLLLTVDTRNAPAIRMAEALGFEKVETHVMREKRHGRWIDEHDYRLPLINAAS